MIFKCKKLLVHLLGCARCLPVVKISFCHLIWFSFMSFFFIGGVWYHYQKIDKYKQKYRGNISVGKFPRDFTDGNIPSVLSWEKKLKLSKKKRWRVIFTDGIYSVGKFISKLWTLFIISITKGITDGKFHRYFPESSRIIRFSIALLIVVLYRQNHQRIEKSSVLFGGFLKKI